MYNTLEVSFVADHLSPEKRSWNMAHIKSKDTSVEVKVRSCLFRNGFRFRKNVSDLPGKPDIVLPKYKTVIFVHGCFWHRHNCKRATTPKTRVDYWTKKFARNVDNDRKHIEDLQALGWRVMVVWECEINKDFENTMGRIINFIKDA